MQIHDVQDKLQGGYTRKRTSDEFITVHHAADHYPQHTGLGDIEAVRKWHMEQGNKWPGIGYHIALAEATNGGLVEAYLLGDLGIQRAHVWGQNHRAVGIACLTDFGSAMPGEKWVLALAEAIRTLIRPSMPQAKIVGHKEITLPGHGSACPGAQWLTWKPRLISLVDGATPQVPVPTPGTLAAHPALKAYWERSGGPWQPDRFALGNPVAPLDPATGIQRFERGALRLNPNGTIDPLLLSEYTSAR